MTSEVAETAAIGTGLGQVDRAIYDLEHGWPEAALDAVGRLQGILHRAVRKATPHPDAAAPITSEGTVPIFGPSSERTHVPEDRS